jgi:glycosyltransferase involved in cell wall biosynthesis
MSAPFHTQLAAFLKKYPRRKKRICFTTCEFTPDKGGVSKSGARITRFLVEEGFEVHVFTPCVSSKPFCIEVMMDGLFIYRMPFHGSAAFTKIISIVDKIISFDLFHGFFFYHAEPCIPLTIQRKRPLIASIRGIEAFWMFQNDLMKAQAYNILEHSAWITSVSSASLKKANSIKEIENKSSFIANSIEIRNVKPWVLTKHNRGVIGTAAVFREKKNLPLLIKAYAGIPQRLRKKLLLVGSIDHNHESLRAEVEELVKKYKLESEVIFTGHVSNRQVYKYLKRMNVFVISSDHEGLPNALLEAASLGIPIVSTNIDGISDICENEVDALLVPPKNQTKLTSAIVSLLKDDDLCRRVSSGAIKLSKKFDMAREKKAWVGLYRKLLKKQT